MTTKPPSAVAAAPTQTSVPATRLAPLAPLLPLILGIALVLVIGFAGSETLHDAAHDLRHSSGFPCH